MQGIARTCQLIFHDPHAGFSARDYSFFAEVENGITDVCCVFLRLFSFLFISFHGGRKESSRGNSAADRLKTLSGQWVATNSASEWLIGSRNVAAGSDLLQLPGGRLIAASPAGFIFSTVTDVSAGHAGQTMTNTPHRVWQPLVGIGRSQGRRVWQLTSFSVLTSRVWRPWAMVVTWRRNQNRLDSTLQGDSDSVTVSKELDPIAESLITQQLWTCQNV